MLDAAAAAAFGLTTEHYRVLIEGCDQPSGYAPVGANDKIQLSKAFWRVDSDADPELRHTILSFVAFRDLQEKIKECGGNRKRGIEAFCSQNDGEGWMLPETLRLTDYGLGHDERAKEDQPVARRLGPRFYDWQLKQDPEESWRECHLHARNLLGEGGYRQLLDDIEAEKRGDRPPPTEQADASAPMKAKAQGTLFD